MEIIIIKSSNIYYNINYIKGIIIKYVKLINNQTQQKNKHRK